MGYLFKLFEMILLALSIDPSSVACIIDVLWPYIMGFWVLLASAVFSFIWKYILIVFYSVKNYINSSLSDLLGFDSSLAEVDEKDKSKKKDENENWAYWFVGTLVVSIVVFTGLWYFASNYWDGSSNSDPNNKPSTKATKVIKPSLPSEIIDPTIRGNATEIIKVFSGELPNGSKRYELFQIDPQTRMGT